MVMKRMYKILSIVVLGFRYSGMNLMLGMKVKKK
jgi:hypothetical protein